MHACVFQNAFHLQDLPPHRIWEVHRQAYNVFPHGLVHHEMRGSTMIVWANNVPRSMNHIFTCYSRGQNMGWYIDWLSPKARHSAVWWCDETTSAQNQSDGARLCSIGKIPGCISQTVLVQVVAECSSPDAHPRLLPLSQPKATRTWSACEPHPLIH